MILLVTFLWLFVHSANGAATTAPVVEDSFASADPSSRTNAIAPDTSRCLDTCDLDPKRAGDFGTGTAIINPSVIFRSNVTIPLFKLRTAGTTFDLIECGHIDPTGQPQQRLSLEEPITTLDSDTSGLRVQRNAVVYVKNNYFGGDIVVNGYLGAFSNTSIDIQSTGTTRPRFVKVLGGSRFEAKRQALRDPRVRIGRTVQAATNSNLDLEDVDWYAGARLLMNAGTNSVLRGKHSCEGPACSIVNFGDVHINTNTELDIDVVSCGGSSTIHVRKDPPTGAFPVGADAPELSIRRKISSCPSMTGSTAPTVLKLGDSALVRFNSTDDIAVSEIARENRTDFSGRVEVVQGKVTIKKSGDIKTVTTSGGSLVVDLTEYLGDAQNPVDGVDGEVRVGSLDKTSAVEIGKGRLRVVDETNVDEIKFITSTVANGRFDANNAKVRIGSIDNVDAPGSLRIRSAAGLTVGNTDSELNEITLDSTSRFRVERKANTNSEVRCGTVTQADNSVIELEKDGKFVVGAPSTIKNIRSVVPTVMTDLPSRFVVDQASATDEVTVKDIDRAAGKLDVEVVQGRIIFDTATTAADVDRLSVSKSAGAAIIRSDTTVRINNVDDSKLEIEKGRAIITGESIIDSLTMSGNSVIELDIQDNTKKVEIRDVAQNLNVKRVNQKRGELILAPTTSVNNIELVKTRGAGALEINNSDKNNVVVFDKLDTFDPSPDASLDDVALKVKNGIANIKSANSTISPIELQEADNTKKSILRIEAITEVKVAAILTNSDLPVGSVEVAMGRLVVERESQAVADVTVSVDGEIDIRGDFKADSFSSMSGFDGVSVGRKLTIMKTGDIENLNIKEGGEVDASDDSIVEIRKAHDDPVTKDGKIRARDNALVKLGALASTEDVDVDVGTIDATADAEIQILSRTKVETITRTNTSTGKITVKQNARLEITDRADCDKLNLEVGSEVRINIKEEIAEYPEDPVRGAAAYSRVRAKFLSETAAGGKVSIEKGRLEIAGSGRVDSINVTAGSSLVVDQESKEDVFEVTNLTCADDATEICLSARSGTTKIRGDSIVTDIKLSKRADDTDDSSLIYLDFAGSEEVTAERIEVRVRTVEVTKNDNDTRVSIQNARVTIDSDGTVESNIRQIEIGSKGELRVANDAVLKVESRTVNGEGEINVQDRAVIKFDRSSETADSRTAVSAKLNVRGNSKMDIVDTEVDFTNAVKLEEMAELKGTETSVLVAPSLDAADGTTIKGSLTLRTLAKVNGILSPGNSPGELVVDGDLVMSSSTVLFIENDGTNYDMIVITGKLIYNGTSSSPTIKLAFLDSYVPKVGDSLTPITFASSENLNSISLVQEVGSELPSDLSYQVDITPTSIVLTVVSGSAPTTGGNPSTGNPTGNPSTPTEVNSPKSPASPKAPGQSTVVADSSLFISFAAVVFAAVAMML